MSSPMTCEVCQRPAQGVQEMAFMQKVGLCHACCPTRPKAMTIPVGVTVMERFVDADKRVTVRPDDWRRQ